MKKKQLIFAGQTWWSVHGFIATFTWVRRRGLGFILYFTVRGAVLTRLFRFDCLTAKLGTTITIASNVWKIHFFSEHNNIVAVRLNFTPLRELRKIPESIAMRILFEYARHAIRVICFVEYFRAPTSVQSGENNKKKNIYAVECFTSTDPSTMKQSTSIKNIFTLSSF